MIGDPVQTIYNINNQNYFIVSAQDCPRHHTT